MRWISGVRSFASSSETPCAANGGGFVGKRLGRIRHLAGHVGLGVDGPLLDGPHRLAGHPVEDVGEPLLRHLGDGVDGAAVDVEGHQVGRRREVVVPQPVVHGLEVPLALAGAGVEADERLGEQVGAEPPAAPVVAARGARGHVQQPALGVERHQPPHVGVPGEAPRAALPGVGPERVVRLRHRVEDPAPLAGVHVERLHRAGGVEPLLDAVGHAAPHDDEVLEDHRWRRLVEHLVGHRVREALGQQHPAAVAEAGHQGAVGRVQRVEAVAAVDEDPHVPARARLPVRGRRPDRHAAVLEAAGRAALRARAPRLGIERPQLLAGLGVEGDHPRVHGRHVDDVVDHQGHDLEAAGPGAEGLVGQLVGLPGPGDLEPADVRGVDVGERRVLRRPLVGPDVGPLHHAVRRLLRRRPRARRGDEERRGENRRGADGVRVARFCIGCLVPEVWAVARSRLARHRRLRLRWAPNGGPC